MFDGRLPLYVILAAIGYSIAVMLLTLGMDWGPNSKNMNGLDCVLKLML